MPGLTDRTLQSLVKQARSTGKRVERADGSDYPGLRFRAAESGRGVWFYRYREAPSDAFPTGRLRMIKLGRYPQLGLKQARRLWEDVVEGRQKTGSVDAVGEGKLLFEEAVRDYIERVARPGLRSWKEVHRALYRDGVPAWGARPVDDIDRADVRAVLGTVHERGAPIASNRLRAYLHRLFGWLLEQDLIGSNPVAGIKRLAPERQRESYLYDAQIESLLQNLRKSLTGRNAAAVADVLELMLRLGCRKGELCAMTWDEVDLDNATWHLPAERSKNKRPTEVPLPTAVVDLFRHHARHGDTAGYVFPTAHARGHLRPDTVNEVWQRARSRLGLEHLRPHDLRHTAMTGLARLGCPEPVRMRIANHTPSGIASRYAHHEYTTEAREWLERWNEHLGALGSKGEQADTTMLED